jgi:antitoxin HicB
VAQLYEVPLLLALQPGRDRMMTSAVLPKLVTEGETVAVALTNVQDALLAVVELYEDLGKPLPDTILRDSNRIR